METWQADIVRSYLPQLIENTKCTEIFLAIFISEKMLSEDDCNCVRSVTDEFSKASILYRLLQTRTNSYAILKKALSETRQSGALDILNNRETHNTKKVTPLITNVIGETPGDNQKDLTCVQGSFGVREVVALWKINREEESKFNLIKIMSNLPCHSNIAAFFHAELATSELYFYFAFEMCKYSVQHFIDLGLQLPLSKLQILKQITTGLQFLHQSDIIHKNLKPSNILFIIKKTQPAMVKLSNFGVHRQMRMGNVSKYGSLSTKVPRYWSFPEYLKILWDLEADRAGSFIPELANDIFTLGCIFYYVLTGKHPFGNGLICVMNIVHGKPAMISNQQTEDNASITSLIQRMIQMEPSNRPTCQSILDALNDTDLQMSSSKGPVLANTKYIQVAEVQQQCC